MPADLISDVWEHSPCKNSELLLLLAIADGADAQGITHSSVAALARKARLSSRQVQRLLRVLEKKGELTSTFGGGHGIPNLYRVTSGVDGVTSGVDGVTRKAKSSVAPLSDETWPGLRDLILSFGLPLEYLDDDNWWNATSHAVGGINMHVLDREFGKIEAYLIEHPRKRPQPRGWKRFVRTWLQKAHEYERKYHGRSA